MESLIQLNHYTVAIGASAGGLEAIHEFFDNMPSSRNLSFVIIQHLSPDYKSLLVELVSKHTDMKVFEATHDTEVQKNCVYVIPNNKLLTISGGKLQLNQKGAEKAPNTAIDTFFKSLAADQGSKAIAVILSGTGTDGTKGAAVIQQNGGMVLVQDPMSAKFDGMPNSVIAAGYADYILAPELMPEEIFGYTKEFPIKKTQKGKPDESSLPEVLQLIEKHCGHDFHNYKSPTILRRISRRMGQLGKKNFTEYLELLRASSEECKILGKEFLIGVTKFFRDKSAFDILLSDVLPQIVANKVEGDVLKVWVAACSTGQEAYSLALLIDDYLNKQNKNIEVKIFATDVDLDAIETASKGIYPKSAVAELEPEMQRKYFLAQKDSVSIVPYIRKQIVFARHNILKDPPFIKNDLITCRNMLIYMNNILQRKVFDTLQFSLNVGGYLFLGPSEIPAAIRGNLEEVNGKWKIYRKIKESSSMERLTGNYAIKNEWRQSSSAPKENAKSSSLAEDFKNILTDQYGYAAVYIDDNYEIKEAVGDFRRYLFLPDKIVNLNVLKMVNTDLSVALNTAIRKSKKEERQVALFNIKVKNNGVEKSINIFVKPASKDNYSAIVFGESQEVNFSRQLADFVPQHQITESAAYVAELEEELKETRYNLQMAVESLETTNEELQSSNEELLSANEELQSSNEELQSLNEELHTLNTEHQLRIKELIELNDDLNNYFRSSQIGQVFVDHDLRIRKFNTSAVQMVNLIESDVGRPIDHISTNIKGVDLTGLIRNVLSSGRVIETEVELHNETMCLMRILPYVKQEGIVDGVVITFIDITENKELNNIVKAVFNSSGSSLLAFKAVRNNQKEIEDFVCIAANNSAESFFSANEESLVGKHFKKAFKNSLVKNGLFEKSVQLVKDGAALQLEIMLEHDDLSEWAQVIGNKMMDGLVLNIININDKKQAEEKLKKNYHELIKAKEELKSLNAGLEQKVKNRTEELQASEERFRLITKATSDAIWDWNIVNNELWWSESFYKMFGYKPTEDHTNNNLFRLQNIHPDDRKKVQESIYATINENRKNWSDTYRFKKADGNYSIILDKASVLYNEQGMPYRMLGAIVDITETEAISQKLKEKNGELQNVIKEFQFVTDFMPQMVWATQPDGYHDFYNKQWYDYTGLTYEQTKNKGWSLVLHPDDYERTWEVWKESLETGKLYETEYRMRRFDGEYRWFLARALPLRSDEGKIIKWFGTCTDITDQKVSNDILEQKVKERTQELEKANIELETSNHDLQQFASVASHDLKEPLRKIHIFSNLVKERYMKNADDGAVDYIDRIINSSARMTKLINDLLTFSRLSMNSLFEKTDLNLVISEVLSDLELLIKEKKANIEVADFPAMDVVPGQMRQVFQNLISNSLKFAHGQRIPHLKINCELVDECSFTAKPGSENNYCRITVSDNGIGFNQQYANKIFTIFQRLHSREKYEGTGIGLAITKKIIEKHNGIIMAESVEDKGTTFVIVLPLEQEYVENEMADITAAQKN